MPDSSFGQRGRDEKQLMVAFIEHALRSPDHLSVKSVSSGGEKVWLLV